MKQNFNEFFDRMIAHEAGYVNHPADKGGPTNLGVTIATLSGWLGRKATIADVKALTKESVRPLYKKQYWDAVRGDDLPSGVDYFTADYGVNSGVSRAIKELQRAVSVTADGVMGVQTLAAVKAVLPRTIIERLSAQRMKFLKGLSNWGTFGKGWTNRVNDVTRVSLAMTDNNAELPRERPSTVELPKATAADTSVIEVIKKPEAWGPLAGLVASVTAVASGTGPLQYVLAFGVAVGILYGVYKLVKRERAS